MNLIRDYYYRFQVLVHEVAKFGIVGAVGFVVQLGVQNELHSGLKIGPTVAVVMGYCVATVVTFCGNKYWAFKHRKGKGLGQESITFILLNGVGIVIQVGLVDAAYYGLDMRDTLSYNAATIVGIGLATLFRLYSYRKFVFMAQPSSVPAETIDPQNSLP
ncbi:MAG: GtrA family protein [Nocardiopsaceae bacterium]|nr:GtrA family protein [Nocardiopsaceae bacterium]